MLDALQDFKRRVITHVPAQSQHPFGSIIEKDRNMDVETTVAFFGNISDIGHRYLGDDLTRAQNPQFLVESFDIEVL